jgi:hypothetical protein
VKLLDQIEVGKSPVKNPKKKTPENTPKKN